jgi:glutamate-1-semialdehyde 2,1-aminomutase
VGLAAYDRLLARWLPKLALRQGLFFAFPAKTLDTAAANVFVARELQKRPGSRGLLMIRPEENPDAVTREIAAGGWAGFKVYHLFGNRPDTQDCLIGEFLPDWAWEIADRHGLVIMLHLVRMRSLADPENQTYIREHCRRYPGAKLILAHAARGFCGPHTVEGLPGIKGLSNVYFDTSAICESLPLEAILREYGPRRLLFGTDFPVSEFRGKAFTIGDGYFWVYDDTLDWVAWRMGAPTLVGIESLLALQQACRSLNLADAEVERIFSGNVRELLFGT